MGKHGAKVLDLLLVWPLAADRLGVGVVRVGPGLDIRWLHTGLALLVEGGGVVGGGGAAGVTLARGTKVIAWAERIGVVELDLHHGEERVRCGQAPAEVVGVGGEEGVSGVRTVL